MFGVFGVGHGVNELFVSGEAAHIFRWALASDVGQAWVNIARHGVCDKANYQLMFPAVAKVIDIADGARAGVFDELRQRGFVGR